MACSYVLCYIFQVFKGTVQLFLEKNTCMQK